jgi:hypothetical protein
LPGMPGRHLAYGARPRSWPLASMLFSWGRHRRTIKFSFRRPRASSRAR